MKVEPPAKVEPKKEETDDEEEAVPPEGEEKYATEIDYDALTMTRSLIGGDHQETVPLEQGTQGFLVAKFSDGEVETELPELFLQYRSAAPLSIEPAPKKKKVMKAMKDMKVMRRPSAAEVPAAAAAAPAPMPPAPPAPPAPMPPAPPAPVPPDASEDPIPANAEFGIMYYKSGHSIGIRQCFEPKKQKVTFGGKKARHKSEAQMRDIAHELIALLKGGNYTYAEAIAKGKELVFAH